MTQAVCIKCGSAKFGAWTTCQSCAHLPCNQEELVLSLAYSDHYFDAATLNGFGRLISQGMQIDPSPELMDEIRAKVASDPIVPKILNAVNQRHASNSADQEIWSKIGVTKISDLPDFPFKNFAEFVAAIQQGRLRIGIDYGAARDLSNVTKSANGELVLLALSWTPFLLAIASVTIAVVYRTWWNLLGIPVAFVSLFLSSPYFPAQNAVRLVGAGAVVYCVYSALTKSIIEPLSWACFVFAVTLFAIVVVNRTAWSWAYDAITKSEAVAALFLKHKRLFLRLKK